MQTTMPVYSRCNMKKGGHIAVYILSSLIAGVVIYLFYHLLPVSAVLGLITGFFLEKMYADASVKKRQKSLRLQFRDFMESMSVAVRAGNVEYQAVRSALEDLKVSYKRDSDIVKEVEHILLGYEKGGIELKVLFEDFAERSGLEDIKNFATIYTVIGGKSDRFGDILSQTQEIIGDKIEIEQEIETVIASAKSETYMMLIMPVIIVIAMSCMGEGLLDALFTTAVGHMAATAALVIFALSFFLAVKCSDIEV